MKNFFCFLLALTPIILQSQEVLPADWATTNPVRDRTDCIPVQSYAIFESGTFSNGVGTPMVKFCVPNSCGVRGTLATVDVVDWLSVVSDGDTTRRIGVGNRGYTGTFIQIPPNTTKSYPVKGADLAFTGPVIVKITSSVITVKRKITGDDGDMDFNVTMENPEIILESNQSLGTVWGIHIFPDHYCPNFKPVEYIVLCPDTTLTLLNPCPDPDLWVIWELPNGDIVEGKDSLLLEHPQPGTYYGSTPCQSWEVRILDPESITINSEPIMCSSRTRLSLPTGLVGVWSNGKTGNSIEVTSGGYYADLVATCGTYHTDTVFVEGDYNDFELIMVMHPDTDRVLLTGNLSVWATTNADSLGRVTYEWTKNGNVHPERRVIGAGIYTITSHFDDCVAYGEIEVLKDLIPGCDFPIYAPNAFSPNDDGIEDTFYLSPPMDGIVELLTIFDRWGEKVYEGKNSWRGTPEWDGIFNGQRVQPAVYVWYARVVVGFQVCTRSGSVTSIR